MNCKLSWGIDGHGKRWYYCARCNTQPTNMTNAQQYDFEEACDMKNKRVLYQNAAEK
ncbi:hypothetical protein [Pontibacterium sp.]|uniref:hypothetical protein n=1 Tax=Pontibacterium sp. TaxID=2036026 RepID=UPI0035625DEA